MKKLPTLCLALLAAFASLASAQQPASANPYDLLGRVLTPIAAVFSREAPSPRALAVTFVVEEMTGLPAALGQARAELLVQPPDRALLRGVYAGQEAVFCRVGDAVWVTPATPPFDALATPPEPSRTPKPAGTSAAAKAKKKKGNPAGLAPIVLPFPPQQLALLPVLFQVKEGPEEEGLRTLDAKLMPELARGLGVEEWSARITVGPGEKPVRIRVLGPGGWSLAVRVERLEYPQNLPAATWEAPEGALRLNARQVARWSDYLGRQIDTHRP